MITIKEFKYLVVSSGYEGRLVKKVNKINQKILEDVYYDDVDENDPTESWKITSTLCIFSEGNLKYDSGINTDFAADIEEAKMTESISTFIAFRCESLYHALPIVKILQKIRYCNQFRLDGILSMSIVNNNTLILQMDAESG